MRLLLERYFKSSQNEEVSFSYEKCILVIFFQTQRPPPPDKSDFDV